MINETNEKDNEIFFKEWIYLYPIFFLIIIIFSGYIAQLIPCTLQNMFNNNIYLKHFLGYLTILFLVQLVDPSYSNNNVIKLLGITFILYFVFIFISKTYYTYFIGIICMLTLKYLLRIHKNYLVENKEDKNNINKINNITLIQNIITIIIFILIFIGFLTYMGQKKYQYKNKFSFITFLFGKPDCSFRTNKISAMNSLSYLFSK